jgi:hypothetical protein
MVSESISSLMLRLMISSSWIRDSVSLNTRFSLADSSSFSSSWSRALFWLRMALEGGNELSIAPVLEAGSICSPLGSSLPLGPFSRFRFVGGRSASGPHSLIISVYSYWSSGGRDAGSKTPFDISRHRQPCCFCLEPRVERRMTSAGNRPSYWERIGEKRKSEKKIATSSCVSSLWCVAYMVLLLKEIPKFDIFFRQKRV